MSRKSDNHSISNKVNFSGIDNPLIDKDELTKDEENSASKLLSRIKRGSRLGDLALRRSKTGESSKIAENLGYVSAAAGALEKGRGLKGAGRAVVLSAAKKKIIGRIIKDVGLGDLMYQINTIRQAKMVADMLNEKAKEQPITVYFIALFVAVPKDLIDMFFVETHSWIDWIVDAIGLFCYVVMFIFFFGKGVRWRLKVRLFIIQLIAAIFEIIPLMGILPSWTLSCLYGYFRSKREARELQAKADEINKTIEKKV